MRGRALAVGALVLAAAGGTFALWPRGDEGPEALLAAATPAPDPCLDAIQRAEFVKALAGYLDVGSPEAELRHSDLLNTIAERRLAGCDPLAGTDAFLEMLYAARPFDAAIASTRVDRPDVHEDSTTGITSVATESSRFSFLLPSAYPREAKARSSHDPYPMIVTLHELEDFVGAVPHKYPGEEVIKRRYPKATNRALLDDVIVYAPVATRAKFSANGAIDASRIAPEHMWRRYHVDFDRMVIDGGEDALLLAASHAVFYAGVIVRGDASDVDPAIVKNFAHLKVYVVGTEKSAAKKSLLEGGMPGANVTVGDESGLPAWLKALQRTTPRSFEWIVKDRNAQRLAHWINITVIEPGPEAPTMKVEVLDTKDDPNTVKISTKGIRGISLFLNDRILDLNRPVRVVIDGKPLLGALRLTGRPSGKPVRLPGKLDRSFDVMFDADRDLSVRRSRYYGFLYPVILDAIELPVDGPHMKAFEARVAAEAQAEEYLTKAKDLRNRGDLTGAREWARKAIDVGDTSVRSSAEFFLDRLDEAELRKPK